MTDPALFPNEQDEGEICSLEPLNVCVPSGNMAVRDALAQLLAGLKQLSLDIEETAIVELVLAEALNNIVEHAYPASQPQGPINIRCRHRANGLHFRINDQGNSMPDGHMPLGLPQNIEVDPIDLPEGGYGWFLIKDLAKDIQYHRVGQKNQLELRIAVAIPRFK